MNRHTPMRDSRTQPQNETTANRPLRGKSSRRRWLALLALLALVTTSAALAYPPDPWGTYWYHVWQLSDDRPVKVVGSSARSCHEFSQGSVCAEFRSTLNGTVAGMCCINPADLWSDDPQDCLVGATYRRDHVPEE